MAIARSRCLVRTSEDTTYWEHLIYAAVICRMCRFVSVIVICSYVL
jgi:hypothetical protein